MKGRITRCSFVLFFLALFMFSCEQPRKEPGATDQQPIQMTMKDLVGKTIEYRYGEDIYHVTIDNESEMHWEAMAGGEKGVLEEEHYKSEFINRQKLFITWGEANGIGVSQVLDFEKGVVHNHLLRGRDISIGKGEISILDN